MEESRENHRPAENHWQILSRTVVSSTTYVVIGIDYIGSGKTGYHIITTTPLPHTVMYQLTDDKGKDDEIW